MLSIAPNLLTTQRLILRPWKESDRVEFARLNADPVVMEFMPARLSRDESDVMAARIQAVIEQRGWGFWAVEVKGADVAAGGEAGGASPDDAGVVTGGEAGGVSPDDAGVVTGGEAGGVSPDDAGVVSRDESGRTSPDGAVGGVASPRVPFIGFVGLSVPSFTAHFTPCVEIGWRLVKEHWGSGYASEAAEACLRFGFEKLTLKQIVAFTVPLNKRSIGVMERIGMSRDPADDFDHPKLPPGNPLQRHVLYRINCTDWLNRLR